MGSVLVDQVLSDGTIVEDYDTCLSISEIYQKINQYFPNIRKDKKSKIIIGEYKSQKYAIRCKNITYLGNPHSQYKKRIQIAGDLIDFYNTAINMNAKPILLGIYSYRDLTLFAEFRIDTYINKKAHNSSAHVYSSDLSAAAIHGYFEKDDYFNNHVTVFKPETVNIFLDEILFSDNNTNELKTEATAKSNENKSNSEKEIKDKSYSKILREDIIPKIKAFFKNENTHWNGIQCYQKMINADYRNKYQPEWAGFFLEFEFEKYIKDNDLEEIIQYAQDKKKGGIDLDLYFPQIKSYGDLKTHSNESKAIQGNDWNTVFGIIEQQKPNSHIYYIVCEHSTNKDCLYDYEVTKFWNKAQWKENLMSYHKRMKHDVTLECVYILDINYDNHQYLTKFKQGINSNGKPREPKIMIEQDNLKHFIVEKIIL